MLADAQLPKLYWLEALNYATLLHNISPSHSIPTTPSELYMGMKPLRIFSCVAHAHVSKKSQDKLSAHLLPCTFLGFLHQCTAFHLIHQLLQHFLKSCDVIFDKGGPSSHQECITLEHDATDHNLPTPSICTPSTPTSLPIPSSSLATSYPKHTTCPPVPNDDPHYSKLFYCHCTNTANTQVPEPRIYNKAIANPDATEWLAAYHEEMHTWKNLDMYDIVP
jgi:hypothetical protein